MATKKKDTKTPSPSKIKKEKMVAQPSATEIKETAVASEGKTEAVADPEADAPGKAEAEVDERVRVRLTRHVGYMVPGTLLRLDAAEAEKLVGEKKAVLV